MRKLFTTCFLLSLLIACKKEELYDPIPDPPEGVFEVIVFDQNNQVVFRGKGSTFFIINDEKTQLRLDNPVAEASASFANEIASIGLFPNYTINSPATLYHSSFDAVVMEGWYVSDWDYVDKSGNLKITSFEQNKIRGEFRINMASGNNANPKWGNQITIKGKFYAPCGGYGC